MKDCLEDSPVQVSRRTMSCDEPCARPAEALPLPGADAGPSSEGEGSEDNEDCGSEVSNGGGGGGDHTMEPPTSQDSLNAPTLCLPGTGTDVGDEPEDELPHPSTDERLSMSLAVMDIREALVAKNLHE